MCGILGLAAVVGEHPSIGDVELCRLREMLTHRGPDGAGLWRQRNAMLAHRRLSVIDPSPAGAQPMLWREEARSSSGLPTGVLIRGDEPEEACRYAMVYNGELYNDAELRRELGARGITFRTACDAETVLHAFALWGTDAFARMRGIFAVAIYDTKMNLLTLARDALGVKPLYFFVGLREIMFASEIPPLLHHPDAVSAPNPRMVSAYLTTIRTVLGNETLFQGIHALRAGQMLQCDLTCRGDGPPPVRLLDWWRGPKVLDADPDLASTSKRVREVMEDSIHRQLRADVPVCALLSGGLDSTIIAATTRREKADLLTYCAGAPLPIDCSQDASISDLSCAGRVAKELGTKHAEAHVTRELFNERWPWMVGRLCSPLSTPNEVAIYTVAERLRADGCIVTLSGEGADELFAGYEGPMDGAAGFLAESSRGVTAGGFELRANAWVPPDFKHGILSEHAWKAADEDRWLHSFYDDEFEKAVSESGDEGLAAHLRLHRRINLAGLLQRLDTATMLAGVEGRTPFADADVAMLAEQLPMSLKYAAVDGASVSTSEPGGLAVAALRKTRSRTKIVLREAFAGVVPDYVVERPKASFPLPFQLWVRDHVEVLRRSSFMRDVLAPAAVEAVTTHPDQLWHLAWPMINLAYWGEAMGWRD